MEHLGKFLGLAIAITMLFAPMAAADILITEVLYDPATSESDTEFVELYNTANISVNISGWRLNTTTLQATVPEGEAIPALSHYLIADIDNSNATPPDWPEPDFADEITLTNTNSGVKLIDSLGNAVDIVGWGAPPAGLYQGTAHPHISEGYSLSRRQEDGLFIDTSNNSFDFAAATPTPLNSRSGSGGKAPILSPSMRSLRAAPPHRPD